MRILNTDKDESLRNLLVLLTPEEAVELRDDLEQLISQNVNQNHLHLNDSNFNREITIAIYKPDNYVFFDERVQQLILEE